MNLETLLTKAQSAQPEFSARPRRWAQLWPVYAVLRARGFSCQRAVLWLAREGAVPAGEQARALNAFHVLTTRRNKKPGGRKPEVRGQRSEVGAPFPG